MENATYVTLSRQSGLLRDMATVAQNIANMSTTGYRAEQLVFSEFVADIGPDDPSLSMARAGARAVDLSQGSLQLTGGTFDFAIEGDGFFLVDTPGGTRLTRAGSFTPSAEGLLVAPDGAFLLDAGEAPIFVPPDAGSITVGADGTLAADGLPFAQIGLFQPADPLDIARAEGTRFAPENGVDPVLNGRVLQGFLEQSNVNAVAEITRMIEVQRAYELGQTFLEREDERIRSTIRTTGQ
ncbi:flagellar hook-basal body complex protein [Alphaproteobacteria bacterium GH1-50]|uniref:Flagellar basal-body rod protein FlgF n=1 Tax=Kangsaoukella pontilimi TaxID=2691042 RepID=A0A7C9MG81_9RHOB|nr:flagellar hook-basal body complex protein [Kangsaoukella pontilimi]MXQ08176.1 flagellar hook-basal body complex protein [Kangsaoukella pontilimi]